MYLSVGIAIYNEESTLVDCMEQLRKALEGFQAHLYFCLNGCTDHSLTRIQQWTEGCKTYKYSILQSPKGKTLAQNAILNEIKKDGYGKEPVLFLDADVLVEKECIHRLYEELFRINRLLAVGALTVPDGTCKGLLFHVLNVRNIFPQSEVSLYDVAAYKWYAYQYPQAETDPDWEIRSKIYFHGRCFMLKRAELFVLPDDGRIFDDTYLPNLLHYQYGPGVIRIIYSAKVHYKAYENLIGHWKTYWRIYNDKAYLDVQYPHFQNSRKMETTILDEEYIQSLPEKQRVYFILYKCIIKAEKISYRLLPLVDARKVWRYEKK